MAHENPKVLQGDGAGFGRLRAAQKMRVDFAAICKSTHPSAEIYIDQIRDYAGSQIVFYRAKSRTIETARVAVFKQVNGTWSKENDIIAAISTDY